MRIVYSYPSTTLRFYLNPRGLRSRSHRGLHRGAALRQREEDYSSNSSRDSPRKQKEEDEGDKDDYYALLLSSSLRTPTNSTSTATSGTTFLAPNLAESSISETSVPASPRIIFGSRLAGPAAREKKGWGETRPQEPDNCCMSGCVNCVWDTYREEVEEWSARQMQRQKQGQGQAQGLFDGREVDMTSKVGSIDTGGVGDLDGMGENNLDPDAFFKDLPVGIREFIALEKRLKESKSMQTDDGLG